nr:uncharacterized protein LOC119713615 isoform X4 [Anas platyrhynchos]
MKLGYEGLGGVIWGLGGVPLLLPQCWAQSWGPCPVVCPGAVSPLGVPQPGPFSANPRLCRPVVVTACASPSALCGSPAANSLFAPSRPSALWNLKTLPLRSFNAFLLIYSPLHPTPGCVCPGGGRKRNVNACDCSSAPECNETLTWELLRQLASKRNGREHRLLCLAEDDAHSPGAAKLRTPGLFRALRLEMSWE